MNKSRFAENQLTRMCQAVLSSQKTACILRTSLVLTIFMEQREEYLITLQFFFLMINRNTVLFTPFLCGILMHWILPCIDTALQWCLQMTQLTAGLQELWSKQLPSEESYGNVLSKKNPQTNQTTKNPNRPVSAVASNYWFCCCYHLACRHGTHPRTDGILTTQKDRSMWI